MATENKFLEPWRSLDGKLVMVTRASSGISREICLDLAKAGCKIIAAAQRMDRLKSLCEEINSNLNFSSLEPGNVRAIAVELDVSAKGQEIEISVQKASDVFGLIDSLVNNAGIRSDVSSPLDISEEAWEKTLQTKLTGSWLVTKYVAKCMCNASQKGSIINISSIACLNCGQLPGSIGYTASKAAVNRMTKVKPN